MRDDFKSLFEIYQEDVLLFEGLQYTHRADITLKHVIQKFGNMLYGNFCTSSLRIKNGKEFNTKDYLDIVSAVSLKDNEEFKKYLDFYGYHFGSERILTNKQKREISLNTPHSVYAISFEAKYPTEIDRNKLSQDLYHISRDNNLENIMRYGLLPKDSKTTFHHPSNRIYLLSTKNPEADLNRLIIWLAANTGTPKEVYVNLKIKNYFPAHERFFCDPNLSWGDLSNGSRGVFVHRGIHPDFIEQIS